MGSMNTSTQISFKTIAELSQDQEAVYRSALAHATQKAPYLTALLQSLNPLIAGDVQLVSADDDFRFYIAEHLLTDGQQRLLGELILHGALHLYAEHHKESVRLGVDASRAKLFNLAADLWTNDQLVDMSAQASMEHLIHHTHLGLTRLGSVEEYYQALRARFGNDSGLESALGSSEQGCGSATGVRNDFEVDNGSDPALFALALSEMEKDQILTSITEEIMEALNAEGDWGAGFLPAGLVGVATVKFNATRTPWERELDEYLRPVINRVQRAFLATYKRINRRRHSTTTASGRKVINPGKAGKNFSAMFYADRSGSMAAHEIQMALDEVYSIVERMGEPESLRFAYVDATIHELHTYTGPGSIPLAVSGGGTDMGEGIRHAMTLEDRPDVIIIATDGDTPWPAEDPGIPVIVLLTQAGWHRNRKQIPAYAKAVRMDSK